MIELVNSLQLSSIWDSIKPGIEKILQELNKECIQELWIPEDVYHSIKSGESYLFYGDDGFTILQITQDKYTNTKKLYIWLAYSFDPEVDMVSKYESLWIQIAKQYGCSLLGFRSTRRGWLKKAVEYGYSIGPTEFNMRI